VPNWTVARTPEPFGPGSDPLESQPKVTLAAPTDGAGQTTVRLVEPRNAPLATLEKVKIVSSQLTANE
jgi:hypothetical protein